MVSLYDELAEKIERDPQISAKNSARKDLGILLFSRRADIVALWRAAQAAEAYPGRERPEEGSELRSAVEKLSPLFGERP